MATEYRATGYRRRASGSGCAAPVSDSPRNEPLGLNRGGIPDDDRRPSLSEFGQDHIPETVAGDKTNVIPDRKALGLQVFGELLGLSFGLF